MGTQMREQRDGEKAIMRAVVERQETRGAPRFRLRCSLKKLGGKPEIPPRDLE